MELKDILNLRESEKIAIVGLGKENLQFLEWLAGVVKFDSSQIILVDINEPNQEQILILENLNIDFKSTAYFGKNYLSCLENQQIEYIFKAPGIWSLNPKFEQFRQKKGQDRINSSLVFFMQKFREQIVAITGTKGKSTTSALINHLLSASGFDSKYVGNTTGISPYQYWTVLDQQYDPRMFFVIELSSFQLQDLGVAQISPKYSVITNYFVDHLDQHSNKAEYWLAKDQIFLYQKPEDILVISPTVLEHSPSLQVNGMPQNAFLIDQNAPTEFFNFIKSPLIGQHNQQNVNQAVVVASTIKLKSGGQLGDLTDIIQDINHNKFKYQSTINKFKGLPHRTQVIRTFETEIKINRQDLKFKINFYDDGFATEPEAVISAIKALSQKPREYLWLQISGKDKGSDLTELITTILYKEIENKIYRINYCGAVGQRLLNELYKVLGTSQTVPIEILKETISASFFSLGEIKKYFENWLQELINNYQAIGEFNRIQEIIRGPEITLNILLSPCGSSFDEFKNATQRSEWWIEQVQKL